MVLKEVVVIAEGIDVPRGTVKHGITISIFNIVTLTICDIYNIDDVSSVLMK